MTTELPPGWAAASLGDIFEIVGGSTPRTSEPDFWGGDIPWLTPDDLSGHDDVLISRGRRSITDAGFLSTSTHMLPTGSVLFTSRAPIGYTAIAANPLCTNQGFKSLVPPAGIESRYVYWFLRHATPQIRELGSGTTFKEMSKKRMAAVPFVLPPTAEQKRIVAAIEEHFSRLAAADANLRSVARRIEILEQAVIDQAMKGEVHRLGDRLSEPLRNGFSPPRSSAGNTRVLTLTAVTNRAFTVENTRTAAVPQTQRDRLTLQPDDILIQRSNTPELVGTAALYSGPSGWAVFPDLLIRIRTDHTLLPAYLELALRSSDVRRYFRLSAQGIAGSMPKISQSTVEELEIPIPASISEQRAIARRVSAEVQAVTGVRSGVRTASKRADALRRTVLGAAFAGQLVPQNPYDEPAPALLERIAASRTARPKRQRVGA